MPGGPTEDDVLGVVEKAQRGQIGDEPAIDRGLEVEVELLERLLVGKGGKALEQVDLALAPLLEFDLEET